MRRHLLTALGMLVAVNVEAGQGVSLSAGAGDRVSRFELSVVQDARGSGWQAGTWRARLQFEANLGYWIPHSGQEDRQRIVDLGFTPVFRLSRDAAAARFFVEAGIGAHLLSDTSPYRGRAFSTAFQFGDLVGMGWRLGAQREYELSLRLEHFSNGGIKRPNQGIEFVQLRLVRRFTPGPLT